MPAQQIVGLKCYTKDVTVQNAHKQNADSVWSKPPECLTLYNHTQCTVVTSSS